MSSTPKASWALELCPERPGKVQLYPGHVKGIVVSPQKKITPKRPHKDCISGGGKRRKIHHSSDTVSETQLPTPPEHSDNNHGEAFISIVGSEQDMAIWPATEVIASDLEEGSGCQVDEGDAYEEYVHLVEEQYLAFVQVTMFHYVVQGFDVSKRCGTNSFYHLEARKSGEEAVRLSCLCPEGKKSDCVHKQYYRNFRDARFRMNEDCVKLEGAVVLFQRQMVGTQEETWLNRFSVRYGSESDALRSRTVVTYEGPDSGGGKWLCVRCPGKRCAHVKMAMRLLNVVVGNVDDDGEDEESDIPLDQMFMIDSGNPGYMNESGISYLPILPPEWASLPEDPPLYPRVPPDFPVPTTLPLDHLSRSACGKAFFDPAAPIIQKECSIYTLVGKITSQICVQTCPFCPRHHKCFIGPEPRTLGIFNFNNSVLFTHELLNEYTNRYTGSETPFASFVIAIARVYHGRGERFVGEDLFRSAWFAFASLQCMTGDMSCPECGEMPDTVIFDGVTLSFAKRHLQDTMQPPTYIPPGALKRQRVRVKEQQWIPNTSPQKDLGAKARREPGARTHLAAWMKRWGDKKVVVGEERRHMEQELSVVLGELGAVGAKPVADALSEIYNPGGEMRDWSIRRRYRMLFEQLSANESCIQMVNESGLHAMKRFVTSPTVANASLLVDVPAVMLVCEQEVRTSRDNKVLIELCRWMMTRAEEVLAKLMKGDNGNLENIRNSDGNGDNWKEVSE
ncbi:hypothetical protein VNI00_019316 [Paramarasmius palmivorus]|uniref:HMG domain-containing protein n=1 Tax=Paramarasmius palmivorus TaxID=297713 RepID=A0AAW0ARM1_9AGAR